MKLRLLIAAVLLAIVAAVGFALPSTARAEVGRDKIAHFAGSAAIAAVVYLITDDPRAAALAGLAVGVGKELRDRGRTGFSGRDLAADALGVAAGVGVVYVIKF